MSEDKSYWTAKGYGDPKNILADRINIVKENITFAWTT